MNTFNWLKALGYGVMIWALAGVALWALALTDISDQWAHGIVAVVLAGLAYLFAMDAKPETIQHALGYGAIWVAVGMILDALITRIFDAHVFTSWQYYVGYGLALLAPLGPSRIAQKQIPIGLKMLERERSWI